MQRPIIAAAVVLAFTTACSSSGSNHSTTSPIGPKATSASPGDHSTGTAPQASTPATSHLSGRITATTCPGVADISQLVGKPMQLAVSTVGTLLACVYNPVGTPVGTDSSYNIRFAMHAPPDLPIFTSLAASLANTEQAFGLQAGVTRTTSEGATLQLLMTPDLGPGTYSSYLGATAGGESTGSCTVEALGSNGYVMEITAAAKQAADYTGDISAHTLCGWAEGATRLAMTA